MTHDAAAFSRVNFGIVSRADRNGSAVKAAAYNLCGRLQHDGRRYDFRRKAPEHQAHAVLLPPGAPPTMADPGTLWRAAEAAEKRHDAQVARQVLISIPRQVPASDRMAFAQAIASAWVADGAAVQVDVHCPAATDGDEQPHAHLLMSLRRVTDSGFAKTKAREWNVAFREDGGRAERARVEGRANAWLASRGITARLDLRSLAAQGEDRPPEPSAPAADWQAWKRQGGDPDTAPPTVARTLTHRCRRASLAAATSAADQAAAEAADLTAQLAAMSLAAAPRVQPTPAPAFSSIPLRPAPSGAVPAIASVVHPTESRPATRATTRQQEASMPARPRPTSRRQPIARRPAAEPWMRHQGGLDALPDTLRAAAAASYERWAESRPALRDRHDLADYVAYVQDRQDVRPQHDEPHTAVVPQVDGIGPADQATGTTRRRTHLADLLAVRYPAAPPDLARLIRRIEADPSTRTATLHLRDGARIVDHGDRLEHRGPLTEEAATATAAAAAAHGWQRVTLTGSQSYRDAVGVACALREPPIPTDHVLSADARDRLTKAMQDRAAAAVPALDPASLRDLASRDPAEAATRFLDHAEARARAALSGRPVGTADPRELSRPVVAALIERRDQAADDAREATSSAAAHRAAHPWTSRLLDGASRRRQAAMDDEAARLDRTARQLNRGHDKAMRAIEKDARRQAMSHASALEDWKWSAPVRKAEAQLTAIATARTAIASGDQAVLAAAARGNLRAASATTSTSKEDRVQAIADTPEKSAAQTRSQALTRLASVEAAAGSDPVRQAAARSITAAVVGGDTDTAKLATIGDINAAAEAAAAWHRQHEQQRKAASRATAITMEPMSPTYG